MANRLPEPHSPLRAMIIKVALWGGIPLAIVGLVVVFATIQPTVQSEANRQAKKLEQMWNSRKPGEGYTPSR